MVKTSADYITELNFPKDIEIKSDSINCAGQEVKFKEIKSIRVGLKGTTTNLTAFTGIPTVTGVASKIDFTLDNNQKFLLYIAHYEEWVGFKNKEGMSQIKDGLDFAELLENKTFKYRVEKYLNTETSKIYFKYKWYEFLKDNTIKLGNKRFASFIDSEYEILQDFRKIQFKPKKFNAVKFFFYEDETKEIDLATDADVILYLIKKIITKQL